MFWPPRRWSDAKTNLFFSHSGLRCQKNKIIPKESRRKNDRLYYPAIAANSISTTKQNKRATRCKFHLCNERNQVSFIDGVVSSMWVRIT